MPNPASLVMQAHTGCRSASVIACHVAQPTRVKPAPQLRRPQVGLRKLGTASAWARRAMWMTAKWQGARVGDAAAIRDSATAGATPGPLAVLALDVEFTHLEPVCAATTKAQHGRPARSRRPPSISAATWVAVVDRFGTAPPPLKSYISLPSELAVDATESTAVELDGAAEGPEGARCRVVGGVRAAALRGAPSLAAVRQQVLSLMRAGGCRVLVGHGIGKDLQSLGIEEEADLRAHGIQTFDTMSFPKFQGRGGLSKTLAVLAEEFLDGRRIQRATHDPEEDARAAIDLYVRHVDYEYMVEYETRRVLSRAAAAAAAAGDPDDEEDGEMADP